MSSSSNQEPAPSGPVPSIPTAESHNEEGVSHQEPSQLASNEVEAAQNSARESVALLRLLSEGSAFFGLVVPLDPNTQYIPLTRVDLSDLDENSVPREVNIFETLVQRLERYVDAAYDTPNDPEMRRRALYCCKTVLATNLRDGLRWVPGETIAQIVYRGRELAAREGVEWEVPGFLEERMREALPTEWRAKITAENHGMFAAGGMMHGLEIQVKLNAEGKVQRRLRIADSLRYLAAEADAIANEDIEIGEWYPTQLVACFNGLHGSPNQNIFGTGDYGATSIVVTPTATSHEMDLGHTIAFWVKDSVVEGNAALRTSMELDLPIRVLRHSTKGGPDQGHAPSVGIRYDGLYKVTAALLKVQSGEGHIRYLLQRVEGQTPLDEVKAARPNAEDVRQFKEFKDIFNSVTKY